MSVQTTPWVETLKDCFRYSYSKATDDFDRLESLQKTHDNKISDSLWPTRSRIPLPWAWAAVETATGPAMEYLFPPTPAVRLIGKNGVDPDVVDKATWALHLMLTHRMRIKRAVTRSVKDCFKLDIGYGIVEPITVTPPAVFEIQAAGNKAKMMGRGRPLRSLRYRYLSAGKVLPYPAGTDFNGEDATPYAFLLDLIPEEQFRKMFKDAPRDGDETLLKGDVEAMITEARGRGFFSETSFATVHDKLAGRSTGASGQATVYKNAPVMIPVLKCYARNECRHTWLFCGSEWQIIFDKRDEYDTARCPLVKFDAWLDADRWFPFGMAEGDERVIWEKNILVNAINDLVTMSLRRPLLYDKSQMDEPPDFGANGVVGVPGDVNKTARFMEPPGVDTATFQMMQQMDEIHVGVTGQRDLTARNFTRGGSMAFQDLLQSSTGRERLRHMLMQTGGFQSIVDQTLLYMQTLGAGMDLTFERPAYNQAEGKDFVESFAVTEDDLKHAYEVIVDLDGPAREGSMDAGLRLQRYQAKAASPYWDAWAIQEDLEPDPYRLQRQRLPREVVRQKQAEREAAEMAGIEAGIASKQGGKGGPADAATLGRQMGGTP